MIRGPSGGGVHGGPFHSANPEMYFVHTPGLESDLSVDAVRRQGPAESGDSRQQSGAFFRAQISLPPHQGRVAGRGLHRADRQSGRAPRRQAPDDSFLCGHDAHFARSRGRELAKEGIEAEVIDLRTLLPLDEETILAVGEENQSSAWWCTKTQRPAESPAKLRRFFVKSAFDDLDGPLMRVTALDTPVPYSPPLEEYFSAERRRRCLHAAKELARVLKIDLTISELWQQS